MIYPTTLGNKAKTTRHPETLGRVLCVLCGNPHIKREDLTESELEALDELALALEQSEASRSKERERVAQYRRKKCGTVPYSTVQYGTVRNDQTDRQSVSQSDKQTDSVCANAHAHTREDLPVDKVVEGEVRDPTVPSLKEVVTAATTVMGIPEAYARWWYREMDACGWRTTSGMAVTRQNWRPLLATWHRRADGKELTEAQALQTRQEAGKRTFTAADWKPCADRCGLFRNGVCTRGSIIPPEKCRDPFPPEQCPYFERKENRK